MIDTIRCSITLYERPKIKEELIPDFEYKTSDSFVRTYTLRNLKIRITKRRLPILHYRIFIQGSLNKFVHGNNIDSLSRSDLKKAADKLSEQLGFDFGECNIQRLDFGTCLVLDEKPFWYLRLLGSLQRYKKDVISHSMGSIETVTFFTKSKRVSFYDKLKESKNNKEPIPSWANGLNIIRFEIQYKKNLSAVLGRPLKIKDILERETYNALHKLWQNTYSTITKIKSIRFLKVHFKTYKTIRDFAATNTLNKWIEKGILSDQLNDLKSAGEIKTQKRSEIISSINKLINQKTFTRTKKLVREFDLKINETAKFVSNRNQANL